MSCRRLGESDVALQGGRTDETRSGLQVALLRTYIAKKKLRCQKWQANLQERGRHSTSSLLDAHLSLRQSLEATSSPLLDQARIEKDSVKTSSTLHHCAPTLD